MAATTAALAAKPDSYFSQEYSVVYTHAVSQNPHILPLKFIICMCGVEVCIHYFLKLNIFLQENPQKYQTFGTNCFLVTT